ncbi:hypothetical protein H6S82_13685 [Planktothrix sp. FACHB-1355]|uniref:Uncharacterized protein n=1 Tax=Aerosakkonema funiforme FACHB-1375 TaxID=2949571 RepID=A0A926VLR8_9CYAN|nr:MULTISPECIES: hypothetical protein [Oscillatoriales]MBD2186013.1 hypothetical protein [Aerosakkonema funiforme FACHB-1375]MBD3559906.1 hypothetical protein [Planktothrix sp. FACHB-1355]
MVSMFFSAGLLLLWALIYQQMLKKIMGDFEDPLKKAKPYHKLTRI